jgi:hypothetical protein
VWVECGVFNVKAGGMYINHSAVTSRQSSRLSNSKEQNPSVEADSDSGDQKLPQLLHTQKVQYRVRKNPKLDPILSRKHQPKSSDHIYFIFVSNCQIRNGAKPHMHNFSHRGSDVIFLSVLLTVYTLI